MNDEHEISLRYATAISAIHEAIGAAEDLVKVLDDTVYPLAQSRKDTLMDRVKQLHDTLKDACPSDSVTQ